MGSRSSSKKSSKTASTNKSNTPYIVNSAAENHKRFHSENIGKKPVLKQNEQQSLPTKMMAKHRKPPQIRRHKQSQQKVKLGQLSPNSSHLPPLPPTPLTLKNYHQKQQQQRGNNEYNEWLLICFKNSIIDSLMELMHCDDLKVYVFDEDMISHHMMANDALSAIEYLFECQFGFMANGNAYLDFNGFAAGMRQCNIHFENPEIAIPLIFEQMVGIKTSNQNDAKQIDYNHVFVAEDTFVEWMMNYIRMHLNQSKQQSAATQQFDERIDKLFTILHAIYTQNKFNKYKKNKKNKKQKMSKPISIPTNPVSVESNPFEVESFYVPSLSASTNKRSIQFQALNIPPRRQQYHQYAKYLQADAVSSVSQTSNKLSLKRSKQHEFYTQY